VKATCALSGECQLGAGDGSLAFRRPHSCDVRRCRLGWQVGDLPLMAIKTANRSELKRRLQGYVATGLVILTTSFWTLWSMGEVYYEAWGTSYPGPVAYLMPAVVCLALTLVVLEMDSRHLPREQSVDLHWGALSLGGPLPKTTARRRLDAAAEMASMQSELRFDCRISTAGCGGFVCLLAVHRADPRGRW
jgi:hypothetical protein